MKLFLVLIVLLAALVRSVHCKRNSLCNLHKDYGQCKGHRVMWTFSTFDSKCVTFLYSNCGGNANRFHTKERCEAICADYSNSHPFSHTSK